MKKIVIISSLLLLTSFYSHAQKETWNWTFGSKSGLTFKPDKLRSHAGIGLDQTPNATLHDLPGAFLTQMSNLEGVFSISDKEGDLLFYSNGINIWKADGTKMMDKTGLQTLVLGGHDSSSQSGIVVPYPGSNNRYICVGLGEKKMNIMNYVIVQANSPTDVSVISDVETFSNAVGLLGESMTAVKHANGQDWWIVAVGKPTTSSGFAYLNAWLVTASGVEHSAPKKSTNTVFFVTANTANGYLKFTFDGKYFVYPTYDQKYFIFGEFDNATGDFFNIRNIPGQMYGAEFSPDQKYLYLTATSNSSSFPNGLYIYDFEELKNDVSTSHFKYISIPRPGALQLDPFGRIWAGYSVNRDMVLIDNPDHPESLRIYRLENFLLQNSNFGLPSFSASWFYMPIKGSTGFCVKESQTYTFKVSKGAAALELSHTEWDFGDGSAAITDKTFGEQTQSHTYNKPGTYTITVRAFLQSDGSEAYHDVLKVTVYPCVIPVNPNVHLYH
ncbi:PKD domain-containing protein [Parabacteroides sp. PF5-9]|uniref:PKD domain-containing protein n=1 Tax=Parabacteroides sp. PF5-9 TaxID=1742404 RepID=UPI0024730423|nr:PKD domain-containing protein [Parabacteroides sp. PF5-9]MDH6357555.1 hypothetical protein [Parabacteroides sp. PF5-9]